MEHSHQADGAVAIQKPNTGAIWRTFWFLLAATTIEFIVAFTMTDPSMKMLRISIFLILTLYKAFYIVGEFMHLKHEVKVLIWSIVLPVSFIVWFVIALMVEGDSVLMVR
jgi:cytochrome c oxidase subunit IV